ncbi:hypothetical protein [Nonomuraea cavernae]|uniref:hypothetical protein n=1 Tax=Nonomuraea cavernae TaxID=2045107 RepID=UPI0033CCD491
MTVTVRNGSPRLTFDGPASWTGHRVGRQVRLRASHFDSGANDTLFSAVTRDDSTDDEYAPNAGSCDRAQAFTRAGMYTIGLKVSDDDRARGSAAPWRFVTVSA